MLEDRGRANDTLRVGLLIGRRSIEAHHRPVNAFPLSPGPMAPRRPLGGIVVVAAVVLSIWLLVAAGLQRDDTRGGTVPGPLPKVPTIVQADLAVGGAEIAPAPGADIAPMEGSLSPR